MKIDLRVLFAVLTLTAAACQGGGFDQGGGVGGVAPPIGNDQQIGGQGNGITSPGSGGPTAGPNGTAELAQPGSTLAPNDAQFDVADAQTGTKCPQIKGFACAVRFNLATAPPTPTPAPTATPKGFVPTPTPSPSPTPKPTPTPKAPAGPTPTPSPTPPGTITVQLEGNPSDVPQMTQPDMHALKTVPVASLRMQGDENFALNGYAELTFTVPRQYSAGKYFAVQLYDEGFIRGKRADVFVSTYKQYFTNGEDITFPFFVPQVTVKSGQIWLLVLYGLTYPPNYSPAGAPASTPSPSPSPSSSAAPSPSSSPSAAPKSSPAG